MRKALKIILAATLILQLLVIAIPASAAGGWSVSYAGNVNTDRERYFANTTTDYKYAGENAMYIKYPGTPVADNYVEIKTATTEKLAYGDYTLTFYIKGSRSNNTEICIGENLVIGFSDMERTAVAAADVPSGESSWSKMVYNFNYPDQTETDYVIFRFHGGTQQTVIDEVSLVAAEGIDNYIPDPGFDGVEEGDFSEEPFDTTDYQAKNVIASAGGGRLGISWNNPKTSDLTKVELYNITSGEWVLLSNAFATEPGKLSYYCAEGLTNGNVYNFALRFIYGTRPAFTYFLTGTPTASDRPVTNYGAWEFVNFISGAAKNAPGEMKLEKDETGNTYLKMHSNIDPNLDESLSSNIYLNLSQNISLEPNTKYAITMRSKAESLTGITVMMGWEWNAIKGSGNTTPAGLSGTRDWQNFTFTYESGEKVPSYFQFILEKPGTIWLDDIEIRKMDGNEIVGENVLSNSDFEGFISEEVGTVENVKVSDIGEHEFTVEWVSSTSKTAKVNVYRKMFDNYEYRGSLGLENTKVTFENLSMGTEYTYLLVPENKTSFEGTGTEFTATTLMPDYEIADAKLFKANSQVYAPSGAGNYTVQTVVKDYLVEGMQFAQAVAVYKDNTLEKLYVTEQVLEPQAKGRPGVKVNTMFTLGDGEGYSIEVFALDSMETLNAYKPCKIFK